MIEFMKYFWIILIVGIYSCNNQTDTEKNNEVHIKENSQENTKKYYHINQLEGLVTIDTIKDYSFDKAKLLKIDTLLKIQLSKKIKFDNFLNDYKLIPLKPNLNKKAILLYSVFANTTKLVMLNEELDVIDMYDATYFGGHRIDDGSVETTDIFSIFKKDSIITYNYTIDDLDGSLDTVSADKEMFYILKDGRIEKK